MTRDSVNRFRIYLDLAVVILAGAASFLVFFANSTGCCRAVNLAPLILTLMAYIGVSRGRFPTPQHWLALAGFALVAVGLSVYLHLAYLFDRDGLASTATTPELLFRYLPWYGTGAGVIGAAIGWIIGRNVTAGD